MKMLKWLVLFFAIITVLVFGLINLRGLFVPYYGRIYSLDLSFIGAKDIILSEIFHIIPAEMKIHKAELVIGKDTSLYIQCTIPEKQISSIEADGYWHKLDKSSDKIFNNQQRISWFSINKHDIDYVYSSDIGLTQIFVMYSQVNSRTLNIVTYGMTNQFSKTFWEFINVHNKRL